MHHATVAFQLRRASRDLLLRHIDGSAEIAVDVHTSDNAAPRTALIDLHLIKPNTPGPRPTRTLITEDGRKVICLILANYAEALVRAGYGAVEVPAAWRLPRRPIKLSPPPSDLPRTSPSPTAASAPVPIALPQPQTAVPVVG